MKAADGRTPGLDRQLVIDLLASGLGCPGFNDRQKFALQLAATNYSIIDAAPIFSRFWPFDTLTIKSHAHESLIMVSTTHAYPALFSQKHPLTHLLYI